MFTDIFREDAFQAYLLNLEALIGVPARASSQDIHNLIETGFPASSVDKLYEEGMISAEARDLIIPLNALKIKLMDNERLTSDESDRLYRVAHVTAMAGVLFGSSDRARNWLNNPKLRFSGKSPIAMLSTMAGTRRVEETLIQAAEGLVF